MKRLGLMGQISAGVCWEIPDFSSPKIRIVWDLRAA